MISRGSTPRHEGGSGKQSSRSTSERHSKGRATPVLPAHPSHVEAKRDGSVRNSTGSAVGSQNKKDSMAGYEHASSRPTIERGGLPRTSTEILGGEEEESTRGVAPRSSSVPLSVPAATSMQNTTVKLDGQHPLLHSGNDPQGEETTTKSSVSEKEKDHDHALQPLGKEEAKTTPMETRKEETKKTNGKAEDGHVVLRSDSTALGLSPTSSTRNTTTDAIAEKEAAAKKLGTKNSEGRPSASLPQAVHSLTSSSSSKKEEANGGKDVERKETRCGEKEEAARQDAPPSAKKSSFSAPAPHRVADIPATTQGTHEKTTTEEEKPGTPTMRWNKKNFFSDSDSD